MFQSNMMRVIFSVGVATMLMVGCSSDTAQKTTDPGDLGYVYVTPDNTGLLQYSLSASDMLGRTVYREQFTHSPIVSIQVTEPTMELASMTDPELPTPTVASVDWQFEE